MNVDKPVSKAYNVLLKSLKCGIMYYSNHYSVLQCTTQVTIVCYNVLLKSLKCATMHYKKIECRFYKEKFEANVFKLDLKDLANCSTETSLHKEIIIFHHLSFILIVEHEY